MRTAERSAGFPRLPFGGASSADDAFVSFVIQARPNGLRAKSTERGAPTVRVAPSNDREKSVRLGDRIALRSDRPPVFSLPEGAWI